MKDRQPANGSFDPGPGGASFPTDAQYSEIGAWRHAHTPFRIGKTIGVGFCWVAGYGSGVVFGQAVYHVVPLYLKTTPDPAKREINSFADPSLPMRPHPWGE